MNLNRICYEVGPLLYSPATNKGIATSVIEERFGRLYSLALCLEDSIADDSVEIAEKQLIETLNEITNATYKKEFYMPIVANGGILLKDGKISLEWLKESQELVKPYEKEMCSLYDIFCNKGEYKICRIVDDLFFYVHCYNDLQATDCVNRYKTISRFEVISQGRKVYFFPPAINKGIAVERLKKYITYEKIIAAGDSMIDLPMLEKSDFAIIPKELGSLEGDDSVIVDVCAENIFPDYVCKRVLEICQDRTMHL